VALVLLYSVCGTLFSLSSAVEKLSKNISSYCCFV
jgi:hypothetical protein